MIPALLMRRSRRDSLDWKVWAAEAMEAKEVRSSGRWIMSALAASFLRSLIAVVALEAVRAAR